MIGLLWLPVASAQSLGGFVRAEQGLYTNTIVDASPALDYVEICWPGGSTTSDVHLGGGPTAGGNCQPGDHGFLVTAEGHPNGQQTWLVGRAWCRGTGSLGLGMRLPEPDEAHIIACSGANLGLSGFFAPLWASNHPTLAGDGSQVGTYVPYVQTCGDLEARSTESSNVGYVFCVR